MRSAAVRAYLALRSRLPVPARRRVMYFKVHRRLLRLHRPVTFSEKVNWRIVRDRRDLIAGTCDKLWMKDYATEVAGELVRVPRTYWAGTDLRELAELDLPQRWVLKPNHRSGHVHFGEGAPDVAQLQRLTADWMHDKQAVRFGEWGYSQARPCLLVEEVIGVPGAPPSDVKFFVFAGGVSLVQVDSDRFSGHRQRFYTPAWEPLEVRANFPLARPEPPPAALEAMLAAAARLGSAFDFIRVDLYEDPGAGQGGALPWFGELTPYPSGGLQPFRPRSLDVALGAQWRLPAL